MTRPTTPQTVRARPPVAGNAAALSGCPVDPMADALAIIEELLAVLVDVEAPASREERAALERAHAFLVRARRRGGRP